MIPLIVIRPQPGCEATLASARALGFEAHGHPLFAIRPVAWQAPPRESFDALLIGSANALRMGGAALAVYRGLPTYAVGEATAQAARAVGLDVVLSGRGSLQSVLGGLDPTHRRLLRLAGQERVVLAPPPGISIAERVVYASVPQPLPPELARLLEQPALVLVHSAEAARHFAALCPRRDRIAIAALGPRVAAAAGQGWRAIETAAMPEDAALLALAARMCQDGLGSGQGYDTT